MRCRERLHGLVKEELESEEEWKGSMERSFTRMDKEVIKWNESMVGANCRCELQSPECDAVGSTAVVAIVTPDKIIVANCGDSRAVLCRNGKPVPLSSDHKVSTCQLALFYLRKQKTYDCLACLVSEKMLPTQQKKKMVVISFIILS